MAFQNVTLPAVGDPTRLDAFAEPVIDNLNYLNAAITTLAAQVVPNGSFESGSGANVGPTSWDLTKAGTNTCNLETSAANVRHGAQSFSMTTSGAVVGGVNIITSDFQICAEARPFIVQWLFKSTVAGTSNKVEVSWYDISQSILSTSTVWSDAATNPATWTTFGGRVTPPANAKFFKISVTGVNNATAGSVYWDGFEIIVCRDVKITLLNVAGTFSYTPAFNTTMVKVRMMGSGAGGSGGGGSGDGSFGGNLGGVGSIGNSTSFNGVGNAARGGMVNPNGARGAGGAAAGGAGGAAGAMVTALNNYNVPAVTTTATTNLFQWGNIEDNPPFGVTAAGGNAAAGNGGAGSSGKCMAFGFQFVAAGGATKNSNGTGNAGTAGQFGSGGGGGSGGRGSAGAGGGGSRGGQPGEYAEFFTPVSPGIAYTCIIAAGGAGGAGGTGGGGASVGGAGGAGGDGWMIIEEIA